MMMMMKCFPTLSPVSYAYEIMWARRASDPNDPADGTHDTCDDGDDGAGVGIAERGSV